MKNTILYKLKGAFKHIQIEDYKKEIGDALAKKYLSPTLPTPNVLSMKPKRSPRRALGNR
ncbi:MAG: hypothetical protein RL751_2 [Bacteroidota bacterium]|jgi:hypothetical protein